MICCSEPSTQLLKIINYIQIVMKITPRRVMENISFIFQSVEVISNLCTKGNLNKKRFSSTF